MKRKLNEVWKEQEGSKIYWMVQAPKGRIAFKRKKDALKWTLVTSYNKTISSNYDESTWRK